MNDLRDLDTLARTIYGEARGETWAGKVAVAWVIRNRVDADLGHDNKPDWWGEGYEGVCKKPYQFSCWNPNDPNNSKIAKVTALDIDFRDCLAAAYAVLLNQVGDPTQGANHYFAFKTIARPKWAANMKPGPRIGGHEFLRA